MFKNTLKLIIIFCFFLLITGISAYLTISYNIKNEDIIVVPELVGRGVVNVLQDLSDLGLNTKVKGSEYTSTIPKNHVISQDPSPGTLIKEGRDVRIIFSKGLRSTLMPLLKRMDYQNAGLTIGKQGLLEGNLAYVYNDEVKKNHIIAQFPAAGAEIYRKNRVDLLISKGKRLREFMMADLTGLSIDDAIFHIEKNNLVIGKIKSITTDSAPKNSITAHEPAAGYRISEGKKVSLVINRSGINKGKRKYSHNAGPRLFRYKPEHGFLKRHLKAQLSAYGHINEVFNDYVKPGEEIWIMVPYNTEATVFLYEDNNLVKTQYYN